MQTNTIKDYLFSIIIASLSMAAGLATAQETTSPQPSLSCESGDKVVFLGNGFSERLRRYNYLESAIHAAYPDKKLTIRNLGWSGDEVSIVRRGKRVLTPLEQFKWIQPDTVFLFFGMNESFAGMEGLEAWSQNLEAFIEKTQTTATDKHRQIILISPIAHEDVNQPDMPTGKAVEERNVILAAYVKKMQQVAKKKGIKLIDLFTPSRAAMKNSDALLTVDGILPNQLGAYHFSKEIAHQLGLLKAAEKQSASAKGTTNYQALNAKIYEKNHYHFLAWRPANHVHMWGDRYPAWKKDRPLHELEQLTRLVEKIDDEIHSLPKPTVADIFAKAPSSGQAEFWESQVIDRKDFESIDKVEPRPGVLRDHKFLGGKVVDHKFKGKLKTVSSPEKFTSTLKVADGYKVNLFASEKEFALHNPAQMAFDSKGRLWVLLIPQYPQYKPGEAFKGKLIILEDTNKDGKADKQIVFADNLYIPTGFVITRDGAYVAQQSEVWHLTDTDGDDRGDRRKVVLSGFDIADSHHVISAFTWHPNGSFYLCEGIFSESNVETPYGVIRASNSAIYRFNPRKHKLSIDVHAKHANSWGLIFNRWGRGVMQTTSGPDIWDFSLQSMAYHGLEKPYRGKKGFLVRGRPVAGGSFISSSHFPDDMQETFIHHQSLGWQGTHWDQIKSSGATWEHTKKLPALLQSRDSSYRPVASCIGPDGAVYILDFSTIEVSHLACTHRNPNKDHTHGRILRVTHKDRPLLKLPAIHGQSNQSLLELLKTHEDHVRLFARRELQQRDSAEVEAAVVKWIATLNVTDKGYAHQLTEAFWLLQGHGVWNTDLANLILKTSEEQSKAALIRGLKQMVIDGDVDLQTALPYFKTQLKSSSALVRLEVVLALGKFPSAVTLQMLISMAEAEKDSSVNYVILHTLPVFPFSELPYASLSKPDQQICLSLQRRLLGNPHASNRALLSVLTAWQKFDVDLTKEFSHVYGKVDENVREKLSQLLDDKSKVVIQAIGSKSLTKLRAARSSVAKSPTAKVINLSLTRGRNLYMQDGSCKSCHQNEGQGLDPAFPPLADSAWVKEKNAKNLVNILLHGMHGPIKVKGKDYNGVMPNFNRFNDQEIADVLSYVRHTFGDKASPVKVKQVKYLRAKNKKRTKPWEGKTLQPVSKKAADKKNLTPVKTAKPLKITVSIAPSATRQQALRILEKREGITHLKGKENAPHIVFLVSEPEYRSEHTMPLLAATLHRNYGFNISIVWPLDEQGFIAMHQANLGTGLDLLAHADTVVMSMRWQIWDDEDKAHFHQYLKSGRGIVGFRTANHGWKEYEGWNPRDKEISRLWAHRFFGHHHFANRDLTSFSIPEANATHPVLRGVETPLVSKATLYIMGDLEGKNSPSFTTLLQGKVIFPKNAKKKHQFAPGFLPVNSAGAIIHQYTHPDGGKPARVFYSSIAHPFDFRKEPVRRVSVQGILWALGAENKIPNNGADVTLPYPFTPSNVGDIRGPRARKPVQWLQNIKPRQLMKANQYLTE